MTYTIPASMISNTVFRATCIGTIIDDLNHLSVHNHSGSLGEGASLLQSASAASSVSGSAVYRVEGMFRAATGGANSQNTYFPCTPTGPSSAFGNGFQMVQQAEVPRTGVWTAPCPLAGVGVSACFNLVNGTYTLDQYYVTSPSGIVINVSHNSSAIIAIIDTYAAGASTLGKSSASFAVSSSSFTIIEWKISTSKNPAAGSTVGYLGAFCIRWTGS